MNLTFEQALEFAKLGYKPADIAELINMQTPQNQTEPTPEPQARTEQAQAQTQPAPEQTEPTQAPDNSKEVEELKAQISDLQAKLSRSDIGDKKDTEDTEAIMADIARAFM